MSPISSCVGIDFGASHIDLVQISKNNIIDSVSFPTLNFQSPNDERFLSYFPLKSIQRFCVTGWGARFFPSSWNHTPVEKVSEIDAIGWGAAWAAGQKDCLAVSLGSGTCMVSVRQNRCLHLGGSGIGGKTLLGLGEIMLGTNDITTILKLASQGCLDTVDLTVKKIYPQGIGAVPPTATAAHFGDLTTYSSEDVALGLVNLVTQSIGALALSLARTTQQTCLVFTGKLATSPLVQHCLQTQIQVFEPTLEFIFPPQAAIATAVGATLSVVSSS